MRITITIILISIIITNISSLILHNPSIKLYPKIALTRDQENNQIVKQIFEKEGITCFNLPCLEFSSGKDQITKKHLENTDTIIITSSQGAKTLLCNWEQFQKPSIKIASIGKVTSDIFNKFGIKPFFQPSIATAKTFGIELPLNSGKKILYPTSNLANTYLEDILTSRGFNVTRLNVYQTNAPNWTDQMYEDAKKVDFVTFFSPSAVNLWANRIGTNFTAIVIGPTTKEAAIQKGFRYVYSSDSIDIKSLLDIIKIISLYQQKNDKIK